MFSIQSCKQKGYIRRPLGLSACGGALSSTGPSSLSSLRLFPLPCGPDSSLFPVVLSSIVPFSSSLGHLGSSVDARGGGPNHVFPTGGVEIICSWSARRPGPLLLWPSWPSKTAQDRLKIPQERPKIAQERPKSPQERPKTTPRGPKSDPRPPKIDPGEARISKIIVFP